MKRDVGKRQFQIWLLGDSEPKNWQAILDTPLDPRHPIRHNIWTSVLEVIQDKVYRKCRNRIDVSSIYIRNAIGDPSVRPSPHDIDWEASVEAEIEEFRGLINKYNPIIVLCFGSFSFEFARRVLAAKPKRRYVYWGTKRLGEEFRNRIIRFDVDNTNVIPLLHRSIAGRRFIESHDYFCNMKGASYFEFVGTHIAEKIMQHRNELSIWIDADNVR